MPEIPGVHQALDELARQHRLPSRSVVRLHVAIEEHLTNVILHGYQPGQAGIIAVRFAFEPGVFRILIEDDAAPFNPLEAPGVDTSLPVEDKPLGGLGIHMIRRSVDELEYRRANGRNILVMKSRIN